MYIMSTFEAIIYLTHQPFPLILDSWNRSPFRKRFCTLLTPTIA
jgi:hypothetical protein